MLVLSRKLGESIVLPDCQVTITVIGLHGKRVRLGVAAPRDLPVHRTEVWARVCEEEAQRDPMTLYALRNPR